MDGWMYWSLMITLPSYLLSIEMERLLERGATVSLFSLVVVGSEDEEEKMEAGELSFTESGPGKRAGRGISHILEAFSFHKQMLHTSSCFVYIHVVTECNSNRIIKLWGSLQLSFIVSLGMQPTVVTICCCNRSWLCLTLTLLSDIKHWRHRASH